MPFKTPLQIAVFFAVIGLIGKLTVFMMGIQHLPEVQFYIVVFYLILLLMAVFFGIRQFKFYADKPTAYFDDVKAGVRAGMLFALIIGAITYFYYAKIDPAFFEIKIAKTTDFVREQMKEMVHQGKPKSEILQYAKQQYISIAYMYTPYFQTVMTVFGLTFMAFFNALIFAVFMRKFPGFKK